MDPSEHHSIVIVGGGTAGITVAARLCRALDKPDVCIVEPSDKHYYQPLWTLVGGGVFPKEITERDEADYVPDGVTWIRDRVAEFQPEARLVVTGSGERLGYDQLVVALGIQLDWHKIDGVTEALGQGGVVSNYRYDLVDSTWQTLRTITDGNAIFTFPSTPVKCGGAPQKIMYLAEEAFRTSGVRDRSRVLFMNAKPTIFTSPYYVPAIEKVIRTRGMEAQLGQELIAVRPEAHEAVFKDVKTGTALWWWLLLCSTSSGPAIVSLRWPGAACAARWPGLARACSTARSSFCRVMGFSRKANAPMRVASTAVSIVA